MEYHSLPALRSCLFVVTGLRVVCAASPFGCRAAQETVDGRIRELRAVARPVAPLVKQPCHSFFTPMLPEQLVDEVSAPALLLGEG